MNAPNISQIPAVRWFGVRGARIYGNVCFSMMYLMLVAIVAGYWFVGPMIFVTGWRGLAFDFFAAALLIFAASLLTRMRLKFLAELAEWESQNKKKMASRD